MTQKLEEPLRAAPVQVLDGADKGLGAEVDLVIEGDKEAIAKGEERAADAGGEGDAVNEVEGATHSA